MLRRKVLQRESALLPRPAETLLRRGQAVLRARVLQDQLSLLSVEPGCPEGMLPEGQDVLRRPGDRLL
jgi:hypothetical protein